MLSRYLYHNDEVKYSIITSILKREDFNECLFWISEYYYSGYEIWNLVWKMYYDFYAINSPKLERFITPDEFENYKKIAYSKGFIMVSSSPLTRSSYHASEDFKIMQLNRKKKYK